MRLKLVKDNLNVDYFKRWKLWLGISAALMVLAFVSFLVQGLNYGIDFRGGTTVRTESTQPVDVGTYRAVLQPLGLGDVVISEVFDPNFRDDQNVVMIRIGAQEGQQSIVSKDLARVEATLGAAVGQGVTMVLAGRDASDARIQPILDAAGVAPDVTTVGDAVVLEFAQPLSGDDTLALRDALKQGLSLETIQVTYDGFKIVSVESVGPKVSGELIMTAVYSVIAAIGAVLIYIWLRFEWQFALGAVLALVHDVLLTIGIFSELQLKFDLAIIAALLTIVGYSLNDTVVVFDRVRENLRKYKQMPLHDVLNLSINETMSRTLMTSGTTLLALIALLVLGGDVIRGFVFAMTWGVIVGTYSSIFVASAVLLWLGVKRDWSKTQKPTGNQYADVDA